MKSLRIIAFGLFCASCVPLLFWLHGFNFDQRGNDAFLCGYLTLLLFACGICAGKVVELNG